MAYIQGPALKGLQGKPQIELDALLAKITLAASNFRALFPGDNEPEVGIRYRNVERHSEFLSLQTELVIPTIEQGQKFALSFYYGKIIGTIHVVLQCRATFKIIPEDGEKVTAYITHRGAHSLEVTTFRTADDQNVQTTKDTREYREAFGRAFQVAELKNSAKPLWMSETTFRVLHSLKIPCQTRLDIEQRDRDHADAREEFGRYHYNTNTHIIIEFYRAARSFDAKTRHSRPSGNNFSYGGGPRSSEIRLSTFFFSSRPSLLIYSLH
jgi:hypothetical protein